MAEFMNVGKIVNTHGIRGELKIMPLTDFPEVRFAKMRSCICLHRQPPCAGSCGIRALA